MRVFALSSSAHLSALAEQTDGPVRIHVGNLDSERDFKDVRARSPNRRTMS